MKDGQCRSEMFLSLKGKKEGKERKRSSSFLCRMWTSDDPSTRARIPACTGNTRRYFFLLSEFSRFLLFWFGRQRPRRSLEQFCSRSEEEQVEMTMETNLIQERK